MARMSDDLKHEYHARRRAERRARRLAEYRRGLRPFAVAGWQTSKEHNVGGLVRTVHAAAAAELLLVGDKEFNAEAARTAEQYTEIRILPDAEALLAHVAERRYRLVAVELDERAVDIFDAEWPERPCLLLGAELGGLPPELLGASELVVQIPQWGLVPCLNVAVAGSIAVYHYLAFLHRTGRLDRPHGGLVRSLDAGSPP
jgi:tRNA (guanosine-2'-O-)-methyltransferase